MSVFRAEARISPWLLILFAILLVASYVVGLLFFDVTTVARVVGWACIILGLLIEIPALFIRVVWRSRLNNSQIGTLHTVILCGILLVMFGLIVLKVI